MHKAVLFPSTIMHENSRSSFFPRLIQNDGIRPGSYRHFNFFTIPNMIPSQRSPSGFPLLVIIFDAGTYQYTVSISFFRTRSRASSWQPIPHDHSFNPIRTPSDPAVDVRAYVFERIL